MNDHKSYIGGEWVDPESDLTVEVVNLATGEPFGAVAMASIADVERAAAAFSFEEQRGTTRVVKEPIGVVAMITLWNWPISRVAWQWSRIRGFRNERFSGDQRSSWLGSSTPRMETKVRAKRRPRLVAVAC